MIEPVTNAQDVATRLRDATQHGITITPRGHGSRPRWGEDIDRAILDVSALDAMLDLDAAEQVVTADAGVSIAQLSEAVESAGLYFPPALGTSSGTVGGLFSAARPFPWQPATGRTRDFVLGVEAVRGDGTPFRAGGRVVKNVTGYDLTRFLCGARGRWGIVTRLHWRLLPRPEAIGRITLTFDQAANAASAMTAIRRAPREPFAWRVRSQHERNGRWVIEILEAGHRAVVGAHLEEWRPRFSERAIEVTPATTFSGEHLFPIPRDTSPRLVLTAPFTRWRESITTPPTALASLPTVIYPSAGYAEIDLSAAPTPEIARALQAWPHSWWGEGSEPTPSLQSKNSDDARASLGALLAPAWDRGHVLTPTESTRARA